MLSKLATASGTCDFQHGFLLNIFGELTDTFILKRMRKQQSENCTEGVINYKNHHNFFNILFFRL